MNLHLCTKISYNTFFRQILYRFIGCLGLTLSNISDYTQSNPVALALIGCLINCLVKRTGITKHPFHCLRYKDKLLREAAMLFLILLSFQWVSTRKGNSFSYTCSSKLFQISPFLEVYCGFKVIQLCSCSTQLSMKFYLLINSKLQISTVVFLLSLAECEIFHAYEYENANISWHFHIYQQWKFHAQQSWA